MDRDPTSVNATGGRPVPRLIGIAKASTLFAFCQHHDSTTFRPIENGDIECSAEHAALLGYRAGCYELYAKHGAVSLEPALLKRDSGWPEEAQRLYQRINQQMKRAARAGLADLLAMNARYAEALRNRSYARIRYYTVWFDSSPDIMCSSGKNPQFDFAGNEIQDWSDLTRPAHGVCFSLVASGSRGCAFFSWLDIDDFI
jgi:hypothetical protein